MEFSKMLAFVFLLICIRSKVETIWKFYSGILHFCNSESSKKQPPLLLQLPTHHWRNWIKKPRWSNFQIAEVRNSDKEFSHGLDLRNNQINGLAPLRLMSIRRFFIILLLKLNQNVASKYSLWLLCTICF